MAPEFAELLETVPQADRRGHAFRLPAVLTELMGHASIDTTMTFYVGQNAEATADELWECHQRESDSTPKEPVG